MLYLTALGLINPLGQGKAAVAAKLFSGNQDGLVERTDILPDAAARIGVVTSPLPSLPDKLTAFDCRNNQLALAALEEIRPEIDAAIRRYGNDRIAVILGTSTSGISDGEAALARREKTGGWPQNFQYSQQEPGNLAIFVASLLGLTGPAYTVHTACSSSSKAAASAQRLIKAGFCDAAIIGGADTICGLTLNGFHSLEAITPSLCNPFSVNRKGTNIGEGAAFLLMEKRPAASPQPPIALLGIGENSDGHHICAPEPEGKGAYGVMMQALQTAGMAPSDISYINLHGTGTPLNDLAEGRAVASLFGPSTPCSSTKSLTGHMLGAAGAGELAFLWLTLNTDYSGGLLPPHIWDGSADPDIPELNLVEHGTSYVPSGKTAMLSNSFAFGGSNVSVLVGRSS